MPLERRVACTEQRNPAALLELDITDDELPAWKDRKDGVDRLFLPREQDFLAGIAGIGMQRQLLDVVFRTVVGRRIDALLAAFCPLRAIAERARAVDSLAVHGEPLPEE